MANNYNDPNCIAAWRFEAANLTADSKGGNTLVNTGVVADAANFKEGAASGDWEYSESDEMSIAQAAMDAGFPLTEVGSFTITGWVRPESKSVSYPYTIWSKDMTGTNQGHRLYLLNDNFSFTMEFGGIWRGPSAAGVTVTLGQWYWFACVYDHDAHTMRTYIWDDTAEEVLVDVSTSVSVYGDPDIGAGAFYVGSSANAGSVYRRWDGNIDEMTAWKKALTDDDLTAIRTGTYAPAAAANNGMMLGIHF